MPQVRAASRPSARFDSHSRATCCTTSWTRITCRCAASATFFDPAPTSRSGNCPGRADAASRQLGVRYQRQVPTREATLLDVAEAPQALLDLLVRPRGDGVRAAPPRPAPRLP